MSLLVGQFLEPAVMLRAAHWAKSARYRIADAFSPYPVDGMAELLGATTHMLRPFMFAAGVGGAGIAYGLEAWSWIYNYPLNVGGRTLDSWPAFMLFPYALALAAAIVAGFVGFLWQTGLPRLHDAMFDLDGFERATQDRCMLALDAPSDISERLTMIAWLHEAGAERVWELET